MLENSYQPQVYYGFYREKGRSEGTLIEWGIDVDVLVAVLPPPPLIWVEKSVVKLRPSEAAIQRRYEK